jgi:hypothetical protein
VQRDDKDKIHQTAVVMRRKFRKAPIIASMFFSGDIASCKKPDTLMIVTYRMNSAIYAYFLAKKDMKGIVLRRVLRLEKLLKTHEKYDIRGEN